jgi:hypothetical protein
VKVTPREGSEKSRVLPLNDNPTGQWAYPGQLDVFSTRGKHANQPRNAASKRLAIFIGKEGELEVLRIQYGQKAEIAYSHTITLLNAFAPTSHHIAPSSLFFL